MSDKNIKMKIHFIAIGGSVMHNLAIALKRKGYDVTGSDDEIFGAAKTNLSENGLLPDIIGWNPAMISTGLDAVILGMHAKHDNPELLKAQKLGLKIYSFPEFLYEQSKDKTRVVIAGSHGKTSITAMVMHILKKASFDFDYMVGSSVRNFDLTVRLSDSAPVMIFEGDEYPDSVINKIPKFQFYQPHIALLSGIAWDHINVFPTLTSYVGQFRKFVELIPPGGTLIFNSEDKIVKEMAGTVHPPVNTIPYSTPQYEIVDGICHVQMEGKKYPLSIFGRHNLSNMMGAVEVCKSLGIEEEFCLEAMHDFAGAAKRLELIGTNETTQVFRDFAHAPSKLRATIAAVKEQFPDRKLTACFELHTYSSLDKDFLSEYAGSMNEADEKVVFYDAHTFELKGKELLPPEFVRQSFGDDRIRIMKDAESLKSFLESISWRKNNLLMMSSGNFGGLDLNALANFVTSK